MLPSASFWRDRRVLLTGHTGFKGGWLALWLERMGARVTGVALAPNTEPNLHDAARILVSGGSHLIDVRNSSVLAEVIRAASPEIVFHLAAQPLVRASYRDPLETMATNIMGSAHLLDALRGLEGVRAAVMVTTDKVYRNQEWHYPYREDDALGGHDPYSASKAASEIVIACYRDAFLSAQGTAVASARAGNVIGGGDWSADRLLPDAVRAWQSGQALHVRRPEALRPWQHVLEPLAGYLVLAERLHGGSAPAVAYNFGPDTAETASVRSVIGAALDAFGGGEVTWGDGHDGPHEAGLLALETAKTRSLLGVSPRWSVTDAIRRAMNWYRRHHAGEDARALCEQDIDDYLSHSPRRQEAAR